MSEDANWRYQPSSEQQPSQYEQPPQYDQQPYGQPSQYEQLPQYDQQPYGQSRQYGQQQYYQPPQYGQQQYYQPPQYGQQQYYQPPQYAQQQYYQPPQYGQQQYYQPQLAYVSVGPRFLAHLIDFLVAWVLLIPFSLLGPLVFLLPICYYIVMEATLGATLGKMALGLRVVKTDGSPIGWPESITRNFLRIVDFLFFYLVAAILIWNSPLRQRLGDQVAKTVVVRR